MKILAVGMNYALHKAELGHTEENTEPVLFLKPDSSILKNGSPFFLPDFSSDVQYEAELVVRICRFRVRGLAARQPFGYLRWMGR